MSSRRSLMLMVVLGVAALVVVLMFALGPIGTTAFAASTTKQLSTNFTLVNLGTDTANVAVQYLLDTGATWTAPASSTTFTITGNGGQKAIRQYLDAMVPATGRGSAIVSSDQPLGAVVQIQARNQVNTFAAYKGYNAGSSQFFMPLLSRRGTSASGLTNALIAIQNTGTSNVTVDVKFIGANAGSNAFTKTLTISGGVTYYYDLDDETGLNAPWNGSGVVAARSGGKVAVVVNSFAGANTLQAYNAFAQESVGTSWLVPIFASRLGNGLNTVIRVQNVSASTIAVNGITINCTRNNATPPTTLAFANTAVVASNRFFEVNPVTNLSIPASWQGSCRIASGSTNTASFVQMRVVGGTGNPEDAAAYEGIAGAGTGTKVVVPLVAKRLGNGFATVVNIQNVSSSQNANVTLAYKHSSGPGVDMSTNLVIPAGTSIQENQRLSAFSVGGTTMPDSWQGSLTVTSNNGVPIDAIVQLTFYTPQTGDTLQAHNAFTLP